MSEDSIEKLREYIRHAQAAIAALGIRPRVAYRYPFDHIALEMISKSFSIAEACLLLIEAKHQDEAYGLCRSATEGALILRYLTSDPNKLASRSSKFVAYSLHYKNFWLYHVRQKFADRPQSVTIEEEVRRWNLSGDPEPAIKNGAKINTWKVAHLNHPLDPVSVTDDSKSLHYAVNYFQPSQYVHGSQPALDGYVPDEGVPFVFIPGRVLLRDVPARICMILLTHLHQAICYGLFGMNVGRPEVIGELFAKALDGIKLSESVQWMEALSQTVDQAI